MLILLFTDAELRSQRCLSRVEWYIRYRCFRYEVGQVAFILSSTTKCYIMEENLIYWWTPLFSYLPEEDVEVDNVIWFELEETAQNMGTLYMLKTTFSGKHQPLYQHLEVDPGDIPHDRSPAPDPTSIASKTYFRLTQTK